MKNIHSQRLFRTLDGSCMLELLVNGVFCVWRCLSVPRLASTSPRCSSHTNIDPIFCIGAQDHCWRRPPLFKCCTPVCHSSRCVSNHPHAENLSLLVLADSVSLTFTPRPISEIDCFCLVIGVVQVRLTWHYRRIRRFSYCEGGWWGVLSTVRQRAFKHA